MDAMIGADVPEYLGTAPHVRRLFPESRQVEMDYYKRTGVFPIMYMVVLRQEYYEPRRFVASSIFQALDDSKEMARKRMELMTALRYMIPWLGQELHDIQETFGGDCWPYGLEENRKTLEALGQYLYEQNMIERTVSVDELFIPV